MRKSSVLRIATVVSLVAICMIDGSLFAIGTTSEGAIDGKDIIAHADKISLFIFGPVAKVAGVLGGGYGLISAILTSSIRPLITFGGIGLAVALVPKFINSVFTLLLP